MTKATSTSTQSARRSPALPSVFAYSMLPDLPPKADILDWVTAGGTREALDRLIEQAPDWQPLPEEAPTDKEKEAKAKAKATADEEKLIDELARLERDRLRPAS